jgi:hypothetical protein
MFELSRVFTAADLSNEKLNLRSSAQSAGTNNRHRFSQRMFELL